MSALSVAGSTWSSGSDPARSCWTWWREPQLPDQLERVLERVRVGRRQRAGRRRRPQPLDGRSAGDAGRHPRPAREVDDRDHAAVLEIEPAAVLAACARRRARGGSRSAAGRRARSAPAVGAAPDCSARGGRCPATGVPVCTPHTGRLSTSTETRISAFSWVGSAIQLARPVLPGLQRADEDDVRRGRAVGVGVKPARLEAGDDGLCDRVQVRPDRSVRALAEPHDRAVDVRARGVPRAAPGCRAQATRTCVAGLAGVGDRELEQAPRQRVDDDRVDAP